MPDGAVLAHQVGDEVEVADADGNASRSFAIVFVVAGIIMYLSPTLSHATSTHICYATLKYEMEPKTCNIQGTFGQEW